MTDDCPQKITFGEMREMGLRGLLIFVPTTAAATRSQSTAMPGRMIFGCPILSLGSYAKPAARGAPTSGRICRGLFTQRADPFELPQASSCSDIAFASSRTMGSVIMDP
jgi:hypothetical protein